MTLEESREVIPMMEDMINQIEEQQAAPTFLLYLARFSVALATRRLIPAIFDSAPAAKWETIRQKNSEIRILQEQLRESLNLCEKLNNENRAGNVQALQNDLKQTRELLQSEKEKLQNANLMIKDYQGRLYRVEKEKEFAITHQKKRIKSFWAVSERIAANTVVTIACHHNTTIIASNRTAFALYFFSSPFL